LLAGDEIETVRPGVRVMVTVFVSEPYEFEQVTVIVFEPTVSGTLAGLDAVEPLTVQLTGGVPVVVHETCVVDAEVLLPVVGAVIVTAGAVPRLTVTDFVSEPYELVQTTVMVFAPLLRLTDVGLVAAEPLTVQLTGEVPVDVQATDVVAAVVKLLLAGELIVTTGAVPWLTVTLFVSEPYELVQTTVMVFAPALRLTVSGLVAAEPLTVQLTGEVPVELNTTDAVEAVV